jgi:glycerate kinase
VAQALAEVDGQVLVGLGGTACTDGGTGMLQALGAVLRPDGSGNPLWTFESLEPDTLPDLTRVRALSDVTNPLLGVSGAARTFGPQKGATPEQVDHLESRMRVWAGALAATGRAVADVPGAGAAGGLGAALLTCGAQLVPGFDEVARVVGLADHLAGADLVVTGEGSLDRQTAQGKAPSGVARLARRAGAVVVGLGGRVVRPAGGEFDAVFPIHGEPRTLGEALAADLTAAELRASATEVVRLFRAARS